MRDIKGIYKKFKGMNPGSIILQGKSESESLETFEEILNEKENMFEQGSRMLIDGGKTKFLIFDLPRVITCPFRTKVCSEKCFQIKVERSKRYICSKEDIEYKRIRKPKKDDIPKKIIGHIKKSNRYKQSELFIIFNEENNNLNKKGVDERNSIIEAIKNSLKDININFLNVPIDKENRNNMLISLVNSNDMLEIETKECFTKSRQWIIDIHSKHINSFIYDKDIYNINDISTLINFRDELIDSIEKDYMCKRKRERNLLRTLDDSFVEKMFNEIKKNFEKNKAYNDFIVRIHGDGDFYNIEYLLKWIEIALKVENEMLYQLNIFGIKRNIYLVAYTKSLKYLSDIFNKELYRRQIVDLIRKYKTYESSELIELINSHNEKNDNISKIIRKIPIYFIGSIMNDENDDNNELNKKLSKRFNIHTYTVTSEEIKKDEKFCDIIKTKCGEGKCLKCYPPKMDIVTKLR